MKYVCRKRYEYLSYVLKAIKHISSMNLMFLLLYQWKSNINFIKFHYCRYRVVRNTRIETLIKLIDRISSPLHKNWNNLGYKDRYRIVSRYLIEQLYRQSRSACKYFSYCKSTNKNFTRNFFFSEKEVISEAYGRKFVISPPSKPILLLYSRTKDLEDFLSDCNRISAKKPNQVRLKHSKT
jgi:hypothetical protein